MLPVLRAHVRPRSATDRERDGRAVERLVLLTLVGSLVVYAGFALAARHWVAGLAGLIVAALLALRHPRARFSAYVLLSALVLRGLVGGSWSVVALAVGAILLLQTAPARRRWPRLVFGATRSRSPRDA